jgi:hypothetical protein
MVTKKICNVFADEFYYGLYYRVGKIKTHHLKGVKMHPPSQVKRSMEQISGDQ